MNWKNIAKVFGIVAGVVVVVLAGLLFWGLSKLPSAFQIKQSITPPALKNKEGVEAPKEPTAAQNAEAPVADLPEKSGAAPEKVHSTDVSEETKKAAMKVLMEDFVDTRKPLIDACRSMDKASESGFLKDKKNASGKYFFNSLAQEDKDPLSETAAPPLRQIFRAPGMDKIADMVLKSEEEKDPSIMKKAEFYYEIYRAGSYLKSHTDDLNRVMQQSYNMHTLMKAVAQKPELARVPEVMNFCDDLQKNMNDGGSFDADASADAMQSFLEQNGLKAADVGFDPKYRSKVVLNISNTQLNVSDAWIAQIFAADIEKAMKEKDTK
jgi:hypothetical protein